MGYYRTKIRLVSAIQYNYAKLETFFDFIGERKNVPECKIAGIDPRTGLMMYRRSGNPGNENGDWMHVYDGEWFVKHEDGFITKVSDEYFNMKYTRAE